MRKTMTCRQTTAVLCALGGRLKTGSAELTA